MRIISVIALNLLLAACSGGPQSLGITGPGKPTPITPPTEDPTNAMGTPAVQTGGTSYGGNAGPTTGGSGFWGYNN